MSALADQHRPQRRDESADSSHGRVGILGGTFDPIHYGHLVIAQEAAARLRLDRVLFIPSGHPPHKLGETVTPGAVRARMVELAIQDNARFALAELELTRPGPSYTVDTLHTLRTSQYMNSAWFMIIGGDMLADLPQWRDPQGIIRQLDGIAAMYRPGYAISPEQIAKLDQQLPGLGEILFPIESPQLAVSATLLRERAACGLPLRYLTPDPVVEYILAQGLYQSGVAR